MLTSLTERESFNFHGGTLKDCQPLEAAEAMSLLSPSLSPAAQINDGPSTETPDALAFWNCPLSPAAQIDVGNGKLKATAERVLIRVQANRLF